MLPGASGTFCLRLAGTTLGAVSTTLCDDGALVSPTPTTLMTFDETATGKEVFVVTVGVEVTVAFVESDDNVDESSDIVNFATDSTAASTAAATAAAALFGDNDDISNK
jgi:hypothetical protein